MIFSRRKNDSIPDSGPVYLTPEGAERLKNKLERLKRSIPALAAEAERTAAYGDRSENAEYKEAKGALRRANSQIISIGDQLRRLVIVESGKNSSGVVRIGSTVELRSANGISKTYRIIGRLETRPEEGKISNESPLGKALIGKKIGDKVSVDTPSGEKRYEIVSIG